MMMVMMMMMMMMMKMRCLLECTIFFPIGIKNIDDDDDEVLF